MSEEIGLGAALQRISPAGGIAGDWVVSGEQLVSWNITKLGPQPTEQQIEDARTALAAIKTLRTGLLAEYDSLTPGEQMRYRTAFAGVKAMLDAGDIEEAKKVIELSSTPTEGLAAAKQRMLDLFP